MIPLHVNLGVDMEPSIATDYAKGTGDPEPSLKKIAKAGFRNIHWCHEWGSDHFYTSGEIKHIKKCLKKYDLKVSDLHACDGKYVKMNWALPPEKERLAGVELIKNRVNMAAEIGANVVVLHIPDNNKEVPKSVWMPCLRKSLAEIEPFVRKKNVRIAIENCEFGDINIVKEVLRGTDPSYLGFCLDNGHAAITGQLDVLENDKLLKSRLLCLHLNGNNDKTIDQHLIPFSGTTDWKVVTKGIAKSSYNGPVTLEVSMRNESTKDEMVFLNKAFKVGKRLAVMINDAKKENLIEKAAQYRKNSQKTTPNKINIVKLLQKEGKC